MSGRPSRADSPRARLVSCVLGLLLDDYRSTGRSRVIAFRGAYHGGTAGSMAISGHSVQSHASRAEGLTPLREAALEKVWAGQTTLREVNKVTFVE